MCNAGGGRNLSSAQAFTLAEVLVTLGIIGVVSALTLPVLMAAYQKNVTLTQLKKSYSSLSQAVRLSEADNGFLSDWDVGYGHNLFENYILPYLNIVDYCILGECENKGIHFGLEGNKYVVPAGPNGTDKLPGDKDNTWIVVMSDGSMLYVYQSLYNNYVISRIILDLNGNKRPNRTGKDIFSLLLLTDSLVGNQDIADTVIVKPGIYFEGFGQTRTAITDRSKYYNCNKGGYAFTCGALIQYDGWKINKDYPW